MTGGGLGSELAQEIVQRLRQARERQHVTGAALGHTLGLTAAQISKIETGRQRLPVELLPRWCEAVGITLAEAFGEEYIYHFAQLPFSPHISRLYTALPPAWQHHVQRAIESLHQLYRRHSSDSKRS